MKRRIVLHIGAHKTGTTALQAALQANGDMLDGNEIVVVPRHLAAEMFVHEVLLEAREAIADIRAETVIVTHEVMLGWPFGPIRKLMPTHSHLYPEAKIRLDALAQVFEGFDVQVLYYIRDQASFLESFYIQSVQMGAAFSFEQWISKIDLSQLSWKPLIDAIRSYFPVCVKRFEIEFADSQSNALRRFLAVAAPTIASDEVNRIAFENPANRSLNAVGLSMMTEINNMRLLPDQRHALRVMLQRHVSNIGGPRPSLLSEHQRAALAVYRSENEALATPHPLAAKTSHAEVFIPKLPPMPGARDRASLQHESRSPVPQAYSL